MKNITIHLFSTLLLIAFFTQINAQDCSIEYNISGQTDCDTFGFYTMDLTVVSENGSPNGFDMYVDGLFYRNFPYGQSPYTLRVPGRAIAHNIRVVDADNDACSYSSDFQSVACDVEPFCGFNGNLWYEGECTSDTTYNAYIPIDYSGFDSLRVLLYSYDNNGTETLLLNQDYATHDFPILAGEFIVDNTLYVYYVIEENNPFCWTASEWNDAPDCSNFVDCSFSDFEYAITGCNDNDEFYVEIAFNHEFDESRFYGVYLNDSILIDTFTYSNIRNNVTVGPFVGGCNSILYLSVQDWEVEDCVQYMDLSNACCSVLPDCSIDSVFVYDIECTTDTSYSFSLWFDAIQPTNELFDLYDGFGGLFGTYSLNDLPVRVEHFIGRDIEFDYLKICINDNPDCCREYEFIGPDCSNTGDCRISEVFAEAYECDDNQFYVDIEFDVVNPGSEGFIIRGNGVVYDSFNYGQTYYTLGPIALNCDQNYEFIIIDNERNCRGVYELGSPQCCESDDCSIRDIELFNIECNDDGTYDFTLNFIHEGTTNDFFEVFSEDTLIGYYRYDNLPVRIEGFPSRDVEFDLIRICDNDNPDCCKVFEYRGPDCDGNECNLEILDVSDVQLTASGNILLYVDFEYNTNSSGFDIFANGQFQYYERQYERPLLIELEGISTPDSILLEICVNDRPDCCDNYLIWVDDYVDEGCELFDMTVLQTICDGDFFYLVVDANQAFNNPQQAFSLRGNGHLYGEYSVSQLPVALGPFHIEDEVNELVMNFAGIEGGCQEVSEFEVNCDCVSSIIEIAFEEFNISESAEDILISSENGRSFLIQMYSLDGKKLMESSAFGNYTINKNNYNTGIYVVRIHIDGQQHAFKVFISN